MTTIQIISLLITIFQKAEEMGLIKFDHAKLDALLKLAMSELKGIQRPDDGSPDNPGLGPLNRT